MAEMDEDRVAGFVDDQLRFMRGEGPEPDVSGLPDRDRARIVDLLDLVDALIDARPWSPPLEEDPVAIRLGLVPGKPSSPPGGSGEPSESADPIVASTEDLRFRFAGAVEVDRLPSGAGEGRWAPVARCRALAENVLVFVFRPPERPPSGADARMWLRHDPSLSAIAFTTPDATGAAVVVPGDADGRFIPAEGWRPPGALTWEPLDMALGRYFDQSIPYWDAVASLPREELLDELGSDAASVVGTVFHAVATSRPHLPHKRQARDFVTTLNPAVVVAWADDIRSGRKSSSDVVAVIGELCGKAKP
jgi:hypothetical protein